MIAAFDVFVRPLLGLLDPESAHRFVINALKLAPSLPRPKDDPSLRVRAFGLNFPNPIGMAAGFDKHGEVPDALARLGFGFVEIGTVTPLPQPGNTRPRVFRLTADEGLINRLGFNSEGAEKVLRRLTARAERGGIVGVNVGANKDSKDRIADYVRLIEIMAPAASYLSCNISSPNTPGLRDLQQGTAFDELLARVMEARARTAPAAGAPPILIKIAPDVSLHELDTIVGAARRHRVDGMIIGNTTTGRPASLRDSTMGREAGGLSGRPLFPLATRLLAEAYIRVEKTFPLVGAGGIDSGTAAVAKMRAGATLLQLYSALVFRGLGLVSEIKRELLNAVRQGNCATLGGLVGTDAARLTTEPWPP